MVNPQHLEPVDHRENCRRGLVNQNKNRTHCRRGHPFDEDDESRYARRRPRPEQFEQEEVKQAGALQQQAAALGQQKAAQAQAGMTGVNALQLPPARLESRNLFQLKLHRARCRLLVTRPSPRMASRRQLRASDGELVQREVLNELEAHLG
jgi:hypothetical protein